MRNIFLSQKKVSPLVEKLERKYNIKEYARHLSAYEQAVSIYKHTETDYCIPQGASCGKTEIDVESYIYLFSNIDNYLENRLLKSSTNMLRIINKKIVDKKSKLRSKFTSPVYTITDDLFIDLLK
jgi:hypothetical protein